VVEVKAVVVEALEAVLRQDRAETAFVQVVVKKRPIN
jgi:hypothetical protein